MYPVFVYYVLCIVYRFSTDEVLFPATGLARVAKLSQVSVFLPDIIFYFLSLFLNFSTDWSINTFPLHNILWYHTAYSSIFCSVSEKVFCLVSCARGLCFFLSLMLFLHSSLEFSIKCRISKNCSTMSYNQNTQKLADHNY